MQNWATALPQKQLDLGCEYPTDMSQNSAWGRLAGAFSGAKSAGLRSFALSADWDPETAPANVAVDFYIRAL
jgi:hypothetical protein